MRHRVWRGSDPARTVAALDAWLAASGITEEGDIPARGPPPTHPADGIIFDQYSRTRHSRGECCNAAATDWNMALRLCGKMDGGGIENGGVKQVSDFCVGVAGGFCRFYGFLRRTADWGEGRDVREIVNETSSIQIAIVELLSEDQRPAP